MAERRPPPDFAAIRNMMASINDLIRDKEWAIDGRATARWSARPWGGAKVLICTTVPADRDPGMTYVACPYTVELSWLFDRLMRVCRPFLTFTNKYAFYGRLADAANRYLFETQTQQGCPKELCYAVVRESLWMISQAERGELSEELNEASVRGVRVQLHPGGGDCGAGLAMYSLPGSLKASLANESFELRGKKYTIGESTALMAQGDLVMHMAAYHEAQ